MQLFAVLAVGISCTSFEDKPQNEEITIGPLGEKFDDYFSKLEPFGLSGSFLVAHKDTIVFHKSYGFANRNGLIENTINTLFSTGSLTKQFTATAILKLEEEGKLRISDPISLYLKNIPEDKANITIHHLLTHTSGFPAIVSKNDYDAITRGEFVDRLLTHPLLFEPGSDFLYSNSGYGLLAIIIEDLSGQPFEDFLSSKFLSPSDISYIGYDVAAWKNQEEARNYVDDDDYGTFQERYYPNWNLIGSGGLLSTSLDLYKWMMALKHGELISDASLKKMYTPFLEDYAYGWEVFEDNGEMREHTGSGDGNNSIVQWYVEKDIIFIALSNYSFDGKDLTDYLYEDIYRIVHNKELKKIPKIDLGTIEPIAVQQPIRYRLDSTSYLKIHPFNEGIRIQPVGQEARSLFELGQDYKPQLYHQKNAIAFRAFQLAIEQNDYSGFSQIVTNETRLARIKKSLINFVARKGLDNPKVHPYFSESNEDGLQSYVIISDGTEEIRKNKVYPFLSIVWDENESYRAIGSITQTLYDPSYFFVKTGQLELTGFQWNTKNTIEIRMEPSMEQLAQEIKLKIGEKKVFHLNKLK